MTGRAVAVQGGLAAVMLIAAYTTWQRAPELTTGEVFVVDATKNDLEKVRYEDQESKSWTELSRGKDAEGTFVYVRLSGYDSSGVALPSGHPGVALKMPERLVRGNETAARLFERFAPLRASRTLGALDAAKTKELGLEATKKSIEVTVRGIKRKFAIVPAPPGGSNPYLRDLQDNRVYIVDRAILSDLQSATTNLVERRLHSFRIEDIDRLVVSAGGARREFSASRIESYPGIRLAPAEASDKPDETVKNWHDRVFNLFPSDVLGKDEVPPPSPPVVVLKLEYFSRGRSIGWTEIARAGLSQASSTSPAPTSSDVFARSEFTVGWMKLSGDAQGLLGEGEKLVSQK